MYKLIPITKQNIKEVIRIRLHQDQIKYVADVQTSLTHASFLSNWHGFAFYIDDICVGFCSYADNQKQVGLKIYKLIIDHLHQGRGYGRKMLDMLLSIMLKESQLIYLRVHIDNTAARQLYSARFTEVTRDTKSITLVLDR